MTQLVQYDDFKIQIIQYWKNVLMTSSGPEKSIWLRFLEESRKATLLKGKTVKVAFSGFDFGSFLDHSIVVARGKVYHVPLLLHMDFGTREIVIKIEEKYCIELNAKELQDFVIVDDRETESSVYLTLKHPPRLYRIEEARFEDDDFENKIRIPEIDTIPPDVFGRCFTIRLFFKKMKVSV